MTYKIEKTEAEWKALLAEKGAEPAAFDITRHESTERAFTGKYEGHKADGTYACICCGKPLFDAATKYESGSGWPSYFAPLDGDAVETKVDRSLFGERVEAHCPDCGSHLGHVFEDGPAPTGLRYCMNSASLDFTPK